MNLKDGLYKTIKIAAIKEELKDFKIFSFEEAHNIKYEAGQYLTLVTYLNGEEIRRSYSITSSSFINEPLSIGVKRIENGLFSRLLIDKAQVGDEIITTGAGGFFVLPDNIQQYKQVFFFAAGSGITPIYSLVKEILYKHPLLHVVLIYSNASPSKTIFFNELNELRKKFAERFQLEFLFSNHINLNKARLHRNLLEDFVKTLSVASTPEQLFYICGPQSYMRMCTYSLQEQHIPKENIKKENFNIETVKVSFSLPPDIKKHWVQINFGNEIFRIEVNYPDSILQSARKKGIQLPYSCETGRCGNCVAKCIGGKVWHSYNEVLTEKELDQGLILTCVGHPVGGDVELQIGNLNK